MLMAHCDNCTGCSNCGGCSGCGGALELTGAELAFLQIFAQYPFLPVARKASDERPVYLESGDAEKNAAVLVCLEKKALIDIDYRQKLQGFDYSAYSAYPLHGSMALTVRGQQVLELLEVQGLQDE